MRTDDPWSGIAASSNELLGRRVEGAHPLAIYWVCSDDRAPGLLIRGIDMTSVPRAFPKLRGISIQLSAPDAPQPFARLILQNSDGRSVFLALCRDVIESSAGEQSISQATSSVFLRLSRWHLLLSRARSLEMGPPEIRGLIGELIVLERLVDSVGAIAALHAWVAPDDHPQDFALNTSIIEVKTRVSGARPRVQISSLEQLESAHLPINLVVVELVPSSGSSSFSLNDIVDRVLSRFDEIGAEAREATEAALAARGYLRLDAYSVEHYTVAGIRAFAVGEEFPRLIRSTINHAVCEASYALDLTALASFERLLIEVIPEGTKN
ncbi:PD-(D/E)XK motif protein [Dyella japonica]|nr:PD-(D/E)XK motif protein [Dyella japonica]